MKTLITLISLFTAISTFAEEHATRNCELTSFLAMEGNPVPAKLQTSQFQILEDFSMARQVQFDVDGLDIEVWGQIDQVGENQEALFTLLAAPKGQSRTNIRWWEISALGEKLPKKFRFMWNGTDRGQKIITDKGQLIVVVSCSLLE